MTNPQTILVADDSPSILKLIQVNLEFEGYKTIGALDGKEALEKIWKNKPDLVILDIVMPGLDGWQVLQELKHNPQTAGIPVIMLTGIGRNQDRKRGLELGVSDYVTKPFNVIQLLEAVERILHRSSGRKAPQPPETAPATRVAVVGGTERAHRILQTLLGNQRVQICGLAAAEADMKGSAAKLAQELEIFVTADPAKLFELKGLDLIIETEPHSMDLRSVGRFHPEIEVMRGYSTNFIWSLLEETEISEERARALVQEVHAGAVEKEKLYEDLRQSKSQIEALLSRVVYAQEEERRRIAAEIHDSIAQSLVIALTKVQTAQSRLAQSAPEALRELEELKKIITDSIKEVRQTIFNLRPSTLDDLGLVPTLEHFLKKLESEEGIRASMNVRLTAGKLSPVIETAVYRIVQEALTNIRKHANARQVRVEMQDADGRLRLVISDDGAGFDPHKEGRPEGVGIIGMKERVALLGGTFRVEARRGNGSRILIEVPLSANA